VAASSLITPRRAIRSMVPRRTVRQRSHRAALGVVGDDLDMVLERALAQTLMRRQARSQRGMPRRAASFLNQTNRHPHSPGSAERSTRTGAHALDGVRRASTTTSSTAPLPGAAGSIVMRPPVTARRAARRQQHCLRPIKNLGNADKNLTRPAIEQQ